MIVAGLFNQRPTEDLTCYTSPTITQTYIWPQPHSAYILALSAFAYIFLGIMVVWMWKHYRPCETCGEYASQCRCNARQY